MVLGTNSVLVLNYYQPWTYGGSERFNQLAWEELRQGRSQAFVYVADGGDPEVIEANAGTQDYARLALYRLLPDGTATPMSPFSNDLTGAGNIGLVELVERLAPGYIRSHFPAADFVPALESPALRRIPFIYDVMDLWDHFGSTPWGDASVEDYYVRRSDALVVVSRFLLERFRAANPNGHVVPNAVDQVFLSKISPAPGAVTRQPGAPKRVLYMGSMGGSWFDWDTVRQLAHSLPDHDFTLVGSFQPPPEEMAGSARNDAEVRHAAACLRELAAMPNVQVDAEVPHDDLLPYLRQADIGIIPFKPTELTASVSPLKVFEYLGAGAPVVQSGMPDIESYPGVRTARTAAEFVKLVAENDRATLRVEQAAEIAGFAAGNTWEARIAHLDQIVSGLAAPENR